MEVRHWIGVVSIVMMILPPVVIWKDGHSRALEAIGKLFRPFLLYTIFHCSVYDALTRFECSQPSALPRSRF